MQKNSNKKSCATELLNLVRALKWKIKSVLYHSKICYGSSIPEVMSWKSCLGRPTVNCSPVLGAVLFLYWQSCTGSHALAVLSWQSVLAFLIYMTSSSCPILLVPFGLFCSGFPFLAVMSPAILSCMSCYKRPVLAVLSWQCCARSPVLSLLSACPVLDVLF